MDKFLIKGFAPREYENESGNDNDVISIIYFYIQKWLIGNHIVGSNPTFWSKSNRNAKKVTSWEKERSGNHLL